MFQQKSRNKSFQPDIPIKNIKELIKEGRSIPFPWESISSSVRSWLEAMAKAVNTQPEFLLLGALSVTSCLMGPDCLFYVRERHQEPCNIFLACLCEPGTGKTQAYKLAVEDPLNALPVEILVHDYTSKGLFEHLKSRGGRALICHAEMTSFFENLLKRQCEGSGERQMFCRFHDGNSKIIRTSHGKSGKKEETRDEREQLDKMSLVIGGFCQPQPYINLHQLLGTSDDGFLDRISVCFVNSVILKEQEVQVWNEVLDSFNITRFHGMIVLLNNLKQYASLLFITLALGLGIDTVKCK